MIRKIICIALALLLCSFTAISQAASLDKEFAPEKYTNVSGNYFTGSVDINSTSPETDIYKFTLSPGQIVLIDILPDTDAGEIEISVCDEEERTCISSEKGIAGPDGRVMCAYASSNGGTYFAKIAHTSEVDFSYSISITFFNEFTESYLLPFSASYEEELSGTRYLTYSFSLRSGDAFSLKAENSFGYILFDGAANEVSGAPLRKFDDFNGYCDIVSDSCTATVFIPLPWHGKISADILPHNDYVIEDITLPATAKDLKFRNAAKPFNQKDLDKFTSDFGKDIIDNRPLKFFRFEQKPSQILQLNVSADFDASCTILTGMDSTSPYSGRKRLEFLHQYTTEGGLNITNTLTKSTGKYMVAIQSDKKDISKEALSILEFKAFESVSDFAGSYEYGKPIEKPEIKNVFVDTNLKDAEGKLLIPAINCIKITDLGGNRSYYSPDEEITPPIGNGYSAHAVISYGDVSYQILLGSFDIVKPAEPIEEVEIPEPDIPEKPQGLTWWMIALIAIGVFCLGCVIFLLVYKKDINDVE